MRMIWIIIKAALPSLFFLCLAAMVMTSQGCGDGGSTDITANINCYVEIYTERELNTAIEANEGSIKEIEKLPGAELLYQVTICNDMFNDSEVNYGNDN